MFAEIMVTAGVILAVLVFFNVLFGKGLTADAEDGWFALIGGAAFYFLDINEWWEAVLLGVVVVAFLELVKKAFR